MTNKKLSAPAGISSRSMILGRGNRPTDAGDPEGNTTDELSADTGHEKGRPKAPV